MSVAHPGCSQEAAVQQSAPAAVDDLAREAVKGGKGGADAVRRFLGAIAPVIRRTCRGVLGREHPDLEDTIQDCLVEVTRALPAYRFEAPVSHYVTKISLRAAIATRRRNVTRVRRLETLDVLQRPDVSVSGGDADVVVDQARLVRQLISELSRVQAETLVLRVVLGFSVEEIASISDVSLNTVKTRLRLGKNALRRRLDAGGGSPAAQERVKP